MSKGRSREDECAQLRQRVADLQDQCFQLQRKLDARPDAVVLDLGDDVIDGKGVIRSGKRQYYIRITHHGMDYVFVSAACQQSPEGSVEVAFFEDAAGRQNLLEKTVNRVLT